MLRRLTEPIEHEHKIGDTVSPVPQRRHRVQVGGVACRRKLPGDLLPLGLKLGEAAVKALDLLLEAFPFRVELGGALSGLLGLVSQLTGVTVQPGAFLKVTDPALFRGPLSTRRRRDGLGPRFKGLPLPLDLTQLSLSIHPVLGDLLADSGGLEEQPLSLGRVVGGYGLGLGFGRLVPPAQPR